MPTGRTPTTAARRCTDHVVAADCGWCDWIGHLQLGNIPEDMHVRVWMKTATGYAIGCECDARRDAPETAGWVVRLIDDDFTPRGSRQCKSREDTLAVLTTLEA